MNPSLPPYVIFDVPVVATFLILFVVFRSCVKRIAFIINVRELFANAVIWNQKWVILMFNSNIQDRWSTIDLKIRAGEITFIPKEMLKEAEAVTGDIMVKAEQLTKFLQERAAWESPENLLEWLDWVTYLIVMKVTLIFPWNSRESLKSQLKRLLTLEQECRELIVLIDKLEEAAITATEEKKRIADEERRALEKELHLRSKQIALDKLEREIPVILNGIFQNWNSSTHDPSYPDFKAAEKAWKSMFIGLQEMRDKGEISLDQVIENFLSFGRNFTLPDQGEPISAVEFRAKQITNIAKRLSSFEVAFHDLEEEMGGHKIKVPQSLVAVEKTVKSTLPLAWIQLKNDFQELLDEANKSLDRLDRVMGEARREGQIIVNWRYDLNRITRFEETATSEKYKVKIEKDDDWTRVVKFLEKRAFDLLLNLDLPTLLIESDKVPGTLRKRRQMLSEWVKDRLDKMEIDLSTPQEVYAALQKLKTQIDNTKESVGIPISGDIYTSPEGTSMPAGYERSWQGEGS